MQIVSIAKPKGMCINITRFARYRPISSVSVLSKALEDIVSSQLKDHFEKHAIITQNSFGYRNNHSTISCLQAWQQTVHKITLKNYTAASVFLDFKAGFDCLNPKILDQKLEIYKVGVHTRAWVRNFLSNRTHYISSGNDESSGNKINDGTDQGGKLSCLLFLIYTSEANTLINHVASNIGLMSIGESFLYVDDSITIIEAPSKN